MEGLLNIIVYSHDCSQRVFQIVQFLKTLLKNILNLTRSCHIQEMFIKIHIIQIDFIKIDI